MLYLLVALKKTSGIFNIFEYITFRAAGAAVTSFILSLLFGPRFIAFLKKKKLGQVQRKDGPQTHLPKQGTPTMGGVLIFFVVSVSAILWMRPDDRFTPLMLIASTILAALGFWDDYVKFSAKNPAGISSRSKFLIQSSSALLIVFYLAIFPPSPSCPSVRFPALEEATIMSVASTK